MFTSGRLRLRNRLLWVALLTLIAGATIAYGATAATGDSSRSSATFKILYLSNAPASSSPSQVTLVNGIKQAGNDFSVNVKFRSLTAPEAGNPARMRPLLQQALAERPHALVVQNWAPKSLDDLIRRAVRSGIPVMLAAAGEDRVEATGALGYVGSDNFATGKAGGELMARAGVKHPIVLTIPPGIQLADDRTNGFTRGFGRKVTTVKIPISQLGDTTAMKNIIENTLIKDRSIDGVFSIGSGFNPALMAARSSLGERAKVIHWAAIDGTPEILSGITKKQADFAVDQQLFLQGYEPVKWLALYLRYRFVPIDKLIPTGPAIIDSSNVAQIQALAKRGIR